MKRRKARFQNLKPKLHTAKMEENRIQSKSDSAAVGGCWERDDIKKGMKRTTSFVLAEKYCERCSRKGTLTILINVARFVLYFTQLEHQVSEEEDGSISEKINLIKVVLWMTPNTTGRNTTTSKDQPRRSINQEVMASSALNRD